MHLLHLLHRCLGGGQQDSRWKCDICADYYKDAQYTPCCKSSYCNECIRQKITSNPTEIQCPSCESLFASNGLHKNVNLQAKVNKIIRSRPKVQPPQRTSIIAPTVSTVTTPITITAPNSIPQTQTIQIPHPRTTTIPTPTTTTTLRMPQPVITQNHLHRPTLRPTVILKQSPRPNVLSSPPGVNIPSPSTVLQPANPGNPTTGAATFQVPKTSVLAPPSNPNVVCIECKQRGHKYRDCPLVAQKKQNGQNAVQQNGGQNGEQSNQTATGKTREELNRSMPQLSGSSSSSDNDSCIDATITNSAEVSNTTESGPLNRIPKKVPENMNKKVSNQSTNSTSNQNQSNKNGVNTNVQNINTQRMAPHVQLINNQVNQPLSALNALSSVNALNAARNRMTVNNILMNAALHRAQRGAAGIAPRLINSHNPLLNGINPALALSAAR